MKQKPLKIKLEKTVQTSCYDLHFNKMVFKLVIKEFPDTSEYIKTDVSITGYVLGECLTLNYSLKKLYDHETLAISALQRMLKIYY